MPFSVFLSLCFLLSYILKYTYGGVQYPSMLSSHAECITVLCFLTEVVNI
jgi:hypothetical protein